MQISTQFRQKPRGRALAKGHKFGNRFVEHDPRINRVGRPRRRNYAEGDLETLIPYRAIPRRLRQAVLAMTGNTRTAPQARAKIQLTNAELIAIVMIDLAIRGDVRAAREIRLATEGPRRRCAR